MEPVKEMLQAAIKRARIEYINAPTEKDRREWERLIKVCLEELNATHGRLVT